MDKELLKTQLIEDEGLILHLYKCPAGKNTIGVGHNIDDNPLTKSQLRYLGIPENSSDREVISFLSRSGITKDQALYILNDDIDNVFEKLKNAIPWIVNKPNVVQRSLCNMSFNLGLAGLLEFKKTLALIKSNNFDSAANEMLNSKWAKQVGARAIRIANALRCASNE